ncbi:hypothetical protein [Yinghuangia soli]|uniref:HEAT repeat domain-containing protein n=1 Tax=Yinghuangia soli TaxID=2908204 RepID=A0AA41PTM2_9ACTN|nr:hypothetical protein [Yinghuangia soli]MCF2525653.1 hypothetical protein [Yinghuangia soli]
MTSATELLRAVDHLPYSQRMRETALHACSLAEADELDRLLAELDGLGPYARRTALHMALAARTVGYVERALHDPDMAFRRAALRGIRTLPDVTDAAAARVLDDAPEDLRAAFHRTLLHARRTVLADRLLPDVHAVHGDRDAARLLPACGAGTVRTWLPRLAHAVTAWGTLAKHHPLAALEHAEQECAELGSDRVRGWRWWNARGRIVLNALAPLEPVRVGVLVERFGFWAHGGLPDPRALRAVLSADPSRAVPLLVGPQDRRGPAYRRLCPALLDFADRLGDGDLLAFQPFRSNPVRELFAALPRERRAGFYDAMQAEDGGGVFVHHLAIFDLLPRDRAAREAQELRAQYEEAQRTRGYDDPEEFPDSAEWLPYAEAREVLGAASKDPVPYVRAKARELLVMAASRDGGPGELARSRKPWTGRSPG